MEKRTAFFFPVLVKRHINTNKYISCVTHWLTFMVEVELDVKHFNFKPLLSISLTARPNFIYWLAWAVHLIRIMFPWHQRVRTIWTKSHDLKLIFRGIICALHVLNPKENSINFHNRTYIWSFRIHVVYVLITAGALAFSFFNFYFSWNWSRESRQALGRETFVRFNLSWKTEWPPCD